MVGIACIIGFKLIHFYCALVICKNAKVRSSMQARSYLMYIYQQYLWVQTELMKRKIDHFNCIADHYELAVVESSLFLMLSSSCQYYLKVIPDLRSSTYRPLKEQVELFFIVVVFTLHITLQQEQTRFQKPRLYKKNQKLGSSFQIKFYCTFFLSIIFSSLLISDQTQTSTMLIPSREQHTSFFMNSCPIRYDLLSAFVSIVFMRSNLRSLRGIIFGAINYSRSSSQRLSFCLKEEIPYKSLEILVIYCFNEKSIIQFFSNRLSFNSLFLYDFRSQYYQQAPQQFSPRSASIISQRSLNSREWRPLFFLRKYSNHLRSRQKRKRRARAMTVNIAKQIPKSMLVGFKLVKSQQSEKKLLDQKFCTYSEKVSQIFCIVLWDCIQQIQVMEINKPDKGLFKGMGPLQVEKHINKKYFPRIRNIHQFEYTHYHPNDNVSTFQRFFSDKKSTPIYQKVNKNTNQSSLQLGNDSKNYFTSLAKTDYKQFQRVKPPTLIRQKQQGITLGEQIQPTKHYMTTTMQQFGQSNIKEKAKVTFRDRGAQRFNPITGQTRTLNFGFEDFSMNRDNAYRANNFSYIPQKGERVDIISGRRLTYK